MKPCASCKNPQACAKAGKCMAKPMTPPASKKAPYPSKGGQWK